MVRLGSVLVVVILITCLEGKLPDIFEPCKEKDPNLTKCIEEHAKEVIPKIIKGIEELNIPPLTPFKLPEIKTLFASTYKLQFNGVAGIETAELRDLRYDLSIFQASANLHFPEINLYGNYSIEGKIGDLPVNGNGVANITLEGVTYDIVWLFKKVNQSGVDYLELVHSTLFTYQTNGAKYNFDNLFNGNKTQEKEVNDFLNKNWQNFEDNFSPYVATAIHEIIFVVANLILDSAPYDDVFLPERPV